MSAFQKTLTINNGTRFEIYNRVRKVGTFVVQETTERVDIIDASSLEEAQAFARLAYGQRAYAVGQIDD